MHFFFAPNSTAKPLLLDGLTGLSSTGAYSLRKLTKTAVSAINVRRSTDNATLDVGFAGKDLDTVALASFVGGENLIFPSEVANSWSKSFLNVSDSDTEVAPDGATTADTISPQAATNVHSLYKTFPTTIVGNTYVMSTYIKAGTASIVQLSTGGSDFANCYANFDLVAGTSTQSSGCTPAIVAVGSSGWYRISISAVAANTSPAMAIVFINSPTATRNPSFAGNTADNLIVWGMQVNTVSLKSYVQTVGGYSGDGFVTTWYDQSGNVRHASNSTAARQPKIVSSGVIYTRNNRPVIEWYSSTQSYMNLNTVASSQYPINARRHLHVVCNTLTGLGANSRLNPVVSRSASTNDWAITSYLLLGQDGGAYVSTTPTLVPISYDQTRIMAFGGAATFSGAFQYIGNLDDGITARSYYGSIAEWIHFGTTISDTQRAVFDKSMAKYYGITLA